MPTPFWEFQESTARVYPMPFGLGSHGVPLFECIRILTGTVNILEVATGKQIPIRNNFLKPGKRFNADIPKHITGSIFEAEVSVENFKEVLLKIKHNNRGFWTNLRNQLTLLVLAFKSKKYVDCFLILYRVFEKISIAAPLIYASIQTEYSKVHKFLQSLNSNKNDGELAAFREFLPVLAKEGSYLSLSIEYKYEGLDAQVSKELHAQLDRIVFQKNKKIIHQEFAGESGYEISFTSVLSFFVECRNRLFHNQSSRENFDIWLLNSPETVCEVLCYPTINWLTLILSEIVKVEARRVI